MSEPLRILVVEDNEDDATLLSLELRRGGFAPAMTRVETPEAMREELATGTWDIVVSDYSLPRFAAPEALAVLKESGVEVPFIIVSGTVNEELAVDSLKRGASDFISKGNLTRLNPAVRRELATMVEHRERRRLEGLLQQSQKMEVLGLLAGGIAHDFGNLLTVITSSTHLALSITDDEDPRRPDLLSISEAADRGTAMVKQLLAFGRRQELTPRVIDLNAIVHDTATLMRRAISRAIEFEEALDGSLSPVRVDPSQMNQVLMNLVVNARDAMPNGGTLRFETSNVALDDDYAAHNPGVVPGSYVGLFVSDTGTGMDAQTKARAFEPLFTTKRDKGTGLGLSTVFGIVRQSGGHVTVESEIGRGTTFQVFLPRASADAPSPKA